MSEDREHNDDESVDSGARFSRRAVSAKKNNRFTKRELSEKEEQIAKELKEIYVNSDGSMPDMKHFERRKRRGVIRAGGTFIFACAFLAAAAWAVFIALPNKSGFSEKDVIVEITGSENISIGDSLTYVVSYKNHEAVSLRNVSLNVRYPAGFVIEKTSVPANNDGKDEWLLGDILPNAEGEIEITGKLYGNISEEQSLRAFLTYTPDNFHSEFEKVAAFVTRVADSPATLILGYPADVIQGSAGDILISIQPNSSNTLKNLSLALNPVEGFVVKQSSPSPDKGSQNTWTFGNVSSENKIILHGLFVGSADSDNVDISATLRGWPDSKKSGEGYIFATATTTVKLTKTTMSVAMAVNGSADDSAVHPGDIITGSVTVRNDGKTPQTNVLVRAIFDAPSIGKQSVIKWASIDDPADGDVAGEQISTGLRRGIISWDADKIPALRSIDPGKSVTIDFRLPIKNAADIDLGGFSGGAITATADVQFGKGASKQILSANPLTLSLLSDTSVEVRDDVSVTGSGKERHQISWILKNSFHELASTTLTADFYGDVSVDPASISAPAGSAHFDPEKKQLVWVIDRIPTVLDTAALQFSVVLNSKNPTQTQLSSKVTGHTTDVAAGQSMIFVGDEIVLR